MRWIEQVVKRCMSQVGNWLLRRRQRRGMRRMLNALDRATGGES